MRHEEVTVVEDVRPVVVDPATIEWIEIVSGTLLKVRRAELVHMSFGTGAAPEPALRVVTASGSTSFLPLRHVVRVDVHEP